MKNYNKVIYKIYEEVKHIIFDEITHDTKYIDCGDYYLKIYRPFEDEEDKKYISINRRQIYDFLEDGYLNKTGQGFEGCSSSRDLKTKSVEVKIAYATETNEMVAVSVYSSYLKGKKCVGLTATLNKKYEHFGKEAIKEIIKYDINFTDKFYWCECSDAIEHYYEKFDGFKIPNTYAQEILNIKSEKDKPIVLMDDGYHYRRYSKSLERYFAKIIYGFNSPDTFNKIIEKETALYKKWLDEIEYKHIDESYQFPDKMQIAFDVIDFFYRMTHDGVQFYPPYAIEKLKEYVDFVKSELDSNSYYSRYTKDEIEELYETGAEMLDYCCVLKLHLFE